MLSWCRSTAEVQDLNNYLWHALSKASKYAIDCSTQAPAEETFADDQLALRGAVAKVRIWDSGATAGMKKPGKKDFRPNNEHFNRQR